MPPAPDASLRISPSPLPHRPPPPSLASKTIPRLVSGLAQVRRGTCVDLLRGVRWLPHVDALQPGGVHLIPLSALRLAAVRRADPEPGVPAEQRSLRLQPQLRPLLVPIRASAEVPRRGQQRGEDKHFQLSAEDHRHARAAVGPPQARPWALSFLSQTNDTYEATFSYCLPSFKPLNFSGILRLRRTGQPQRIKYIWGCYNL